MYGGTSKPSLTSGWTYIWLIVVLFVNPPPDILRGLRIRLIRRLRQHWTDSGVVLTSPVGMQIVQDLVTGAFPKWSSGNPEDKTPKNHQEDSKNVHKNCLWGQVLILRVGPLYKVQRIKLYSLFMQQTNMIHLFLEHYKKILTGQKSVSLLCPWVPQLQHC